jgi:hypothetical protein
MMKRQYKSYSTDLKLAVINGKLADCSYSNKHYWLNNGKNKIIQASKCNIIQSSLESITASNSDVIAAFDELFLFIHRIIDLTKKTKNFFKKNRGFVIRLWEILKPLASIEDFCKWFRISESTFFNWKKRKVCKTTYSKECPNIYPNQLRDWERRILEDDYLFNPNYANYSISDLFGQVLADRKVLIGESFFYEYASLIGETEKRKTPRKNRWYKGLKADYPKAIIQMDRTKFTIKNGKRVWVNLIIDNYSRAILGFLVCESSLSKYTLMNFKQAISNHALLEKSFWLVTDDGSENKGEVSAFIKLHPNIKHKIAQKNIPFSNSMIESVIKQLKYNYLKKKEYDSLEELREAINTAIEIFNHRPRKIHLGKTPIQVLHGDEVDLKEFTALKEQVRKERIEENRNFNCMKQFYHLVEYNQN